MKYVKTLPATDKNLSKELIASGFKKIKEPKTLLSAILISLPIACIISLSYIFIIYIFFQPFQKYIDGMFNTNTFNININFNISKLIFYFLIFLVLICTHEFIHLVCIPNFLKSEKTYWGITFYGGFVATTEKISKFRFVIISIMPFLFISIIFPLIMTLLGFLNNFIIFLCFINAAASSVDILNLFIILFQVPNNSYIVNNGNETYYRLLSN